MDRPPFGIGARARPVDDHPGWPQRCRPGRSHHPVLLRRQFGFDRHRLRRAVLPVLRAAHVAGAVHDHLLQDRHHAQLRQPRASRYLDLVGRTVRHRIGRLRPLHFQQLLLQLEPMREPILELLLHGHLPLLQHHVLRLAAFGLHRKRAMGNVLLDRLLLVGRPGRMRCLVLHADELPRSRNPVLHLPRRRLVRQFREFDAHAAGHRPTPGRLHARSQVGTALLHEAHPRGLPREHGQDAQDVGCARRQRRFGRNARQLGTLRRPPEPFLHLARGALQARGRCHLQDVQRLVQRACQKVQQRPRWVPPRL
mmetsp:Transcript_8295/g.23880  ORF Transcript_8295/g.23880 Transcript_8295/m.23880 type:complete len:310 (+) Transcript_8295:442-1371(+)